MSNTVLLDTHVWIWWLSNSLTLNHDQHRKLRSLGAEKRLAVSAISLWETAMLVDKKRIKLDRPLRPWLAQATKPDFATVIAITPDIAAATTELPDWFHRDPADRIIIASAIEHGFAICTKDDAIIDTKLARIFPL